MKKIGPLDQLLLESPILFFYLFATSNIGLLSVLKYFKILEVFEMKNLVVPIVLSLAYTLMRYFDVKYKEREKNI